MKKYLIITIIVILLSIALGVFLFSDTFKKPISIEEKEIEKKEEMISFLELLISDSDTQTTSLVAVDGSSSSGVAYRLFEEGKLHHLVVASMPDPEEGNSYEGWLVQPNPLEFFSTGIMEKNEEDQWILTYNAEGEFSNYYRVVITEETVVDPFPEKHIIEGDF